MEISHIRIDPPFGIAPMAGMTDSAFRRMVKRVGGCGLVVTEMVSSEGLVRGMDRTLTYADFTEEERPVSVQIFGGDPERMAEAAGVVEALGADLVDVNMGCPVPKVARHNAGCSLMREPDHAAKIISAMTKAVRIPVTVKMRAGWNEREINAPTLARMVEDAGASAVAVHGRTAAAAYRGRSDWDVIAQVVDAVRIPVFGNGDLVEPQQMLDQWRASGAAGLLVGRGALRNPWLFAQLGDLRANRPIRSVDPRDRGRFLLEYVDLLLQNPDDERDGFRHAAAREDVPAQGRERWVINKLRALAAWYTRGFDNGSHLRVAINRAETIGELREMIARFFFEAVLPARHSPANVSADAVTYTGDGEGEVPVGATSDSV